MLGSGTATVAYSRALTGLTAARTYYSCAIASNSLGTRFGSVGSFTTAGGGAGVPFGPYSAWQSDRQDPAAEHLGIQHGFDVRAAAEHHQAAGLRRYDWEKGHARDHRWKPQQLQDTP